MKKYELTNETIEFEDRTLYRIRALRDFRNVRKGDLGGFVESEKNLSHYGDCWVYHKAMVLGNARVLDNAIISDYALIYDNARVCDYAEVYGNAIIFDESSVMMNAKVHWNAIINGDSVVSGGAIIEKHGFVNNYKDYVVITNIGSRYDCTTFYKTKDKGIYVSCGCFNDSLEEFKKAVVKRHGNNKFAQEYFSAIKIAELKLGDGIK